MTLDPTQTERVIQLAMDLAREGRAPELAEFLDHGLPVDVRDGEGDTLLMLAAYRDHPETVAMLIERV